jgi:hypothetical protein
MVPGTTGGHYACVLGAISMERGLVHLMINSKKAFIAHDVGDFLGEIKMKLGKEAKFAIFLDNASIHRADYTRNAAQLMKIPLVFNLPYRPDLMGIEFLWAHAKAAFRTHINKFRCAGSDWSNELAARSAI